MRGARPALALLAVPLLVVAILGADGALTTELARLALVVGSCVTVGRLLAGRDPAAVPQARDRRDGDRRRDLHLQQPLGRPERPVRAARAPSDDLPQLHINHLSGSSLDYGDFFAAGVVGGILAAERVPQWPAALLCLGYALAWNQLFLVTDSLPATVPPALTLLTFELMRRVRPQWRTVASQ